MSGLPDDAAGRTPSDAFTRFERARRTNAECAAKVLAIHDEFRKLEQRKVELSTLRKLNTGQRDVWLQDLIEKIVIPYSKAWNLKFAKEMQATFPLEIRSMIHDYLLDIDMWNNYRYALQAVMSAVPPEVGHCCCLTHGQGRPRVPHYLFSEYMGSETAQEIVEKLYRSDWLKDQILYGVLPDLHSLIHLDAFGAGINPVSCIKGLSITCLVDIHRELPPSHAQNEACQHVPYERRYIDREDLESDFDQLLEVVDNKDFWRIEVVFIQRNIRIDVLEEALETLSNVYQAFRSAGVEMHIPWQYSSPTCDGPHDHSLDLGEFFSEARSTWKHQMFQFLENMKPCIQPRHGKYMNEPGLCLSDADFVHRMWDVDEAWDPSEDVESDDDDDDDEEEGGSGSDSGSQERAGAIYRRDGTLYVE